MDERERDRAAGDELWSGGGDGGGGDGEGGGGSGGCGGGGAWGGRSEIYVQPLEFENFEKLSDFLCITFWTSGHVFLVLRRERNVSVGDQFSG